MSLFQFSQSLYSLKDHACMNLAADGGSEGAPFHEQSDLIYFN